MLSMKLLVVCVNNTIGRCGEIQRGRVVHGIYVDRFPPDLRAQRINEGLSGRADTRRLERAAREHHLDIGAWSSGCRRNADRGLSSAEAVTTAAQSKRVIWRALTASTNRRAHRT
jgi:hypothetical protein